VKKAGLIMLALALIAGGTVLIAIAFQKSRAPIEAQGILVSAIDNAPPPRAKKDLPEGWLDKFTLTERSGKKFNSEDMNGKVWAASFFFANCPGECHQQNLSIAQIQKEFGPEGVTFVSITVDPDSDTVEKLREYAHKYTKSEDQWLFLRGDLDYTRRVGAEFFGVAVDKGTHGSRLILIDKWGNIRGYYSTNGRRNPEEYTAIRPKLRELLAETEPPAEFRTEGASGDNPFASHAPESDEPAEAADETPAPDAAETASPAAPPTDSE
jgi:protein SCO1/2